MTSPELKAAARKAAFAARKAAHAAGRDTAQSAAAERLMAEIARLGPRPLAGYMPIRTEIDPLPAMALHRGPVAVPVIKAEGEPLLFRRWSPEAEMIEGAFGALIPASGEDIVPEIVIVPLVAFDRRGFRLGYGGGFYDRTLEALRARGPVTAIGYAFAAQELPEVPVEPTDQPLDLIVTEAGTIRPGRG